MSIDTAVSRIQQIMVMEQQLLDPTAPTSAAPATAANAAAAPAATGPGTSPTFSTMLAGAQAGSSGGVSVNGSGYVNPLAGASVKAERIDQGVDYAGTGTLGALGPGVVTQVVKSGSGWEGGGYVEYKLTSGPCAGKSVYYAEGITPTVSVGQTLAAGQPVATLIPGWPTGIELGWASGKGDQSSYARDFGGGYGEGAMTAAGVAFSNLIASLGGPAGLTEGRQAVGTFS
jgi:hypothetical protein